MSQAKCKLTDDVMGKLVTGKLEIKQDPAKPDEFGLRYDSIRVVVPGKIEMIWKNDVIFTVDTGVRVISEGDTLCVEGLDGFVTVNLRQDWT